MVEKYKESIFNPLKRVEKKNIILTLVAITGAVAGITHKKSMKYGFVLADVLLIADTAAELVINIKNKKGKVY